MIGPHSWQGHSRGMMKPVWADVVVLLEWGVLEWHLEDRHDIQSDMVRKDFPNRGRIMDQES